MFPRFLRQASGRATPPCMESDHFTILQAELKLRRERNPAYSLRSFGRDLGLAPSALSSFLKGRKGLSEKKAASIARKIGLGEKEQELFLLSARAHHARKRAERLRAQAELANRRGVRRMEEREIALAQSWVHQAILELTELRECGHTSEWFARRLGISVQEARAAIGRMRKLGWLARERGRFRATSGATTVSSEIPSQAIRGFHRQMLAKAEQALLRQGVEAREFQSTTFAFDTAKLREAKRAIRELQERFSREFYSASEARDSVYQVSMQFFRLDEEGK